MKGAIRGVVVKNSWCVLVTIAMLSGAVCQGQSETVSKTAATQEVSSKSGASDSIDHYRRTEEWLRVQEYMQAERYYVLTASRWLHKPENEAKSVTDAATALGIQEPDSTEASRDALDVMNSDPSDDLGFMAIQFCVRFSPKEGAEKECEDRALTLLERDYLSDPRIKHELLMLARGAGGDRGLALLDRVITTSKVRALRGEAAYWLVEEKVGEVDDATKPAEERAALREKLTRLAHLVEEQYGDVTVWDAKPAGEQVKPLLFALEHLAVGSVMPDMTAKRVDGSEDSLQNYRGKVVLLDYWATWCVPCVHSLREYVIPLKKELQGQPFEVITLSIDDAPAKVEDFEKRIMPLPLVNWYLGMGSAYYRPWGMSGVPHYLLIDKDGVIRGNSGDAGSLMETARKLVLGESGD